MRRKEDLFSDLDFPPTCLELVLFAVLVMSGCVALKLSAEIVGALCVLLYVVTHLSKRRKLFMMWRTMCVIWVLCLSLTVDIAVRAGDKLEIRYLPVLDCGGDGVAVQRARTAGRIENRDFIIYERPSIPMRTKNAIVVMLPIHQKIQTPTLWYLGRHL